MTFDRHMGVWPANVSKELDVPAQSVWQNLADSVARYPERPALIYHGRTITYAELGDMVDKLAGWLQAQGVAKGDRVLLYMQNAPQFVVGYYAILRSDAVVIPVNPMSRHAELEHYVADTGANVVLAGQDLLPSLIPLIEEGALKSVLAATCGDLADPDCDIPLPAPLDQLDPADATGRGVTRWADAMAAGYAPTPHTAGPDDLCVIPYSSGTTGQPKGCMHTHYTVQVTNKGGLQWNPMDENDISLATLPLFHVTGMQNSMNGPIASGGTIVLMSRWNRATAAELIKRHRVTRWRSITTMAIDLVNDPDVDSYDLGSLNAIGGGGAAMPEAIAKRLKDITGLDYIEGYGMSETIAATHTNPVQAPKRQCLGIPMFDVDSRVMDVETGVEMGPGEVGEIVTHARQVFKGYWNRPEETAKVFFEHDGKTFFRTGDLGYYDAEGYFFMVDRVKRMINASGFKVWPAEVEALMHHNPDIAEVCIIGAQDPRRGETVKAYVVPTPAAKSRLTENDVIQWCRSEMAAYKCPKSVVFTDALPKSGAGKVLWRELTERDAAASQNTQEAV